MELNLTNERTMFDLSAVEGDYKIQGSATEKESEVKSLNGTLMKGNANIGYCSYNHDGAQRSYNVSVTDDDDYDACSDLLRATVKQIERRNEE